MTRGGGKRGSPHLSEWLEAKPSASECACYPFLKPPRPYDAGKREVESVGRRKQLTWRQLLETERKELTCAQLRAITAHRALRLECRGKITQTRAVSAIWRMISRDVMIVVEMPCLRYSKHGPGPRSLLQSKSQRVDYIIE